MVWYLKICRIGIWVWKVVLIWEIIWVVNKEWLFNWKKLL